MMVQVYRINSSSYQDRAFFSKEKEELESIPGVSYITSLTQIKEDLPFILISNTHTNPEDLSQNLLDNTSLWIHPNSGYDNLSQSFVANSKFPVIVGNPIRANAVSEYILGALFTEFTTIKNHPYWSEDRKWNRSLLRDQNVLVIGMGMIGTMVYQSLTPLCKSVVAFDPYSENKFSNSSIKRELNESIIKNKNVVIIAASLTSTSRNLIDSEFLKHLPQDALIINSARGEIIIEEDLIEWLQKNRKAKAYLDVFQKEPFPPGFMTDVRNVVKTSHIAGVHQGLGDDIIKFEKDIIADFCEHLERKDLESFKVKRGSMILTENSINFR